MSKVFRLGDFFGVTATQLVLFQPKEFNTLLTYKYGTRANEGLYSLTKELGFLKKVYTDKQDALMPDYDSLIEPFKTFGYLGLDESTPNGKAKMKISKLFIDFQNEHRVTDNMREKYGDDVDEAVEMMGDKLTLDIFHVFKYTTGSGYEVSISKEAGVVAKCLYDNMGILNEYIQKCIDAYNENNISEKTVAGRTIRDILKLDKETLPTVNASCCYFANQLYNRLRAEENSVEMKNDINDVIRNIKDIQSEYDSKQIVLTDAEKIAETLEDVYSEITLGRFNSITGLNVDMEQANEIFRELDMFLLGGLGFTGSITGDDMCDEIRKDNEVVQNRTGIERNEKLDDVLRLVYIDMMSRKYMRDVHDARK